MTNWVLPDHIADMLPRQTRELETLRTRTLEVMRSHGFEAIRPPMFEFLDSLLTGTATGSIARRSSLSMRRAAVRPGSAPISRLRWRVSMPTF